MVTPLRAGDRNIGDTGLLLTSSETRNVFPVCQSGAIRARPRCKAYLLLRQLAAVLFIALVLEVDYRAQKISI